MRSSTRNTSGSPALRSTRFHTDESRVLRSASHGAGGMGSAREVPRAERARDHSAPWRGLTRAGNHSEQSYRADRTLSTLLSPHNWNQPSVLRPFVFASTSTPRWTLSSAHGLLRSCPILISKRRSSMRIVAVRVVMGWSRRGLILASVREMGGGSSDEGDGS